MTGGPPFPSLRHPGLVPGSSAGQDARRGLSRPWMPGRARHDGGGPPFPSLRHPGLVPGSSAGQDAGRGLSRPWMPGRARHDGQVHLSHPSVTPASCRGPAPGRTHVTVIQGPGCRDEPGMTGGPPFPSLRHPGLVPGSSAGQDARRGLSRPWMPGRARHDGGGPPFPSLRHPGLVPGSSAGQDAGRGLSRPLDAGTGPA